MPRMIEYFESIEYAVVFFALDANSGYWQVDVDKTDRDRMEFISRHGLYRFVRVPFRSKNSPGTFQRTIDVILLPVQW